jgi:hypothetical protein
MEKKALLLPKQAFLKALSLKLVKNLHYRLDFLKGGILDLAILESTH